MVLLIWLTLCKLNRSLQFIFSFLSELFLFCVLFLFVCFFSFVDLISKVLFWVVVHRGNALCPVLLTWNYFILESSCGSGIVVEGALEFFGEI